MPQTRAKAASAAGAAEASKTTPPAAPTAAPPPKQQQNRPQSHRSSWYKVLYEAQPFEDNYVDHSFLEELVKNANVKVQSLSYFAANSMAVTQQLSAMVIFHGVFMEMLSGHLSVEALLATNVALLSLELLVRHTLDPFPPNLFSMLKARTILLAILQVVSPVLLSLTKSYSDDTIWAQAIVLSLLHLFCHDFYFINFPRRHPKIAAPVSLNAALFASVLLASRLENYQSVFALMLFAIIVFAFFPVCVHFIRLSSIRLHTALAALLVAITVSLLFRLSAVCCIAYVTGVALISVACPAWLVVAQSRYKDEIHGPWDIAKIRR